MSTGKRFSLSLLISLLVFTAFSLVAFTSLFPWMEVQFYSPKVVSDLQKSLGDAEKQATSWEKQRLDNLVLLLQDSAFQGVFSPQIDLDRYRKAKDFFLKTRLGGSLRIFSDSRDRLHFSTLDTDFVPGSVSSSRAIYRNFADLASDPANIEEFPPWDNSSSSLSPYRVFVSASGRIFHFVVPFSDGRSQGWALVNLPVEDLRLGLLEVGNPLAVQSLLVPQAGSALFWRAEKPDATLLNQVRFLFKSASASTVQKLGKLNGTTDFSLVSQNRFGIVVPDTLLQLDRNLKTLILVAFFSIVFLVCFLLFSLKGDPVSVVAANIKRLQVKVLQDYLADSNQDKMVALREELVRNSGTIKQDIRRNLGHVGKKHEAWVDDYIDKNWNEILELLSKTAPPPEPVGNAPPVAVLPPAVEPSISLSDFRKLLEETLKSTPRSTGVFGISETRVSPPVSAAKATQPVDSEELEELDDLEELEELSEPSDGASDTESAEVEEVEEAEEVEEVEAVDDLEAVEAEDLEELEEEPLPGTPEVSKVADDEPEEIEEIEELEELDEVEDAEPLGHLPGLAASSLGFKDHNLSDQDGTVPMLEPQDDGVSELETLEEIDELESPEVPRVLETTHHSLNLETLDLAWRSSTSVFREEDEVVSLKAEVFRDASAPDDELGKLLTEVAPESGMTGFVPMEDSDIPKTQYRDWRWTGAGFDWDRFAGGDDEVDLFRALSDAVSAFEGLTAAIVTKKEENWSAQSSVGFSDAGKTQLNYGVAHKMHALLERRELHVLSGGGSNPLIRESFHVKDVQFLKTVLCVPLLFRRQTAWLFLGLRRQTPDPLELLAPRTIS